MLAYEAVRICFWCNSTWIPTVLLCLILIILSRGYQFAILKLTTDCASVQSHQLNSNTKQFLCFTESLLHGSEICNLSGDQHVNIWYPWCFIQSVLAFPVCIKRQRELEILGVSFHVSISIRHHRRNVAQLSSKHISWQFIFSNN